MKISVVIPAFNEEKYIGHTIDALHKQTIKDFELIIVDNNSTDQTAAIAKERGAIVLTEKNQGHVYALNAGMNYAHGDIIAVTDADTMTRPDWLDVIVRNLAPDDVVGVTGSAEVDTGSKIKDMLLTGFYSGFMSLNEALGKPHVNGFSFAVKRNAFIKAGSIDLRFHISSDTDLGIRLSKYGKVKYIKELAVLTSFRRFEKKPHRVFWKYVKAYFYAVWFRKPPPFKLNAVR